MESFMKLRDLFLISSCNKNSSVVWETYSNTRRLSCLIKDDKYFDQNKLRFFFDWLSNIM